MAEDKEQQEAITRKLAQLDSEVAEKLQLSVEYVNTIIELSGEFKTELVEAILSLVPEKNTEQAREAIKDNAGMLEALITMMEDVVEGIPPLANRPVLAKFKAFNENALFAIKELKTITDKLASMEQPKEEDKTK